MALYNGGSREVLLIVSYVTRRAAIVAVRTCHCDASEVELQSVAVAIVLSIYLLLRYGAQTLYLVPGMHQIQVRTPGKPCTPGIGVYYNDAVVQAVSLSEQRAIFSTRINIIIIGCVQSIHTPSLT